MELFIESIQRQQRQLINFINHKNQLIFMEPHFIAINSVKNRHNCEKN